MLRTIGAAAVTWCSGACVTNWYFDFHSALAIIVGGIAVECFLITTLAVVVCVVVRDYRKQ